MPVVGCNTTVFIDALQDLQRRFGLSSTSVYKKIVKDVFPTLPLRGCSFSCQHNDVAETHTITVDGPYYSFVKSVVVTLLLPCPAGFEYETATFDAEEQQILCL